MSASRAVLGMCLRSPDYLAEVVGSGVSPLHFENVKERQLYLAMLEEERSSGRVDVPGMCARHPEHTMDLVTLLEEAPVAQNVRYYCEALQTSAWKREAESSLFALLSLVKHHDEFQGRAVLQEQIIAVTDKLALSPQESRSGRMMREVLAQVVGNVEEAMKAHSEGRPLGITTGMPTLDSLFCGGWRKKRVAALCARSGKGKTTLGLCFARNALLAGHKVAFFSVEADAEELVEKIVANEASVNAAKLGNGSISSAEADRFMSAVQRLAETSLVVDDAFESDIELFEARLRRLKRRGLVDLAILDYVQQCRDSSVRNMGKPQEVARVTARVKRLAVSLDIPIIMLAQLNRLVDKEGDFPSIADIADSSSIEKDSDHVLLVHWMEDHPTELVPYMRVAKNRRNAYGQTLKLSADLGFGRFEEVR